MSKVEGFFWNSLAFSKIQPGLSCGTQNLPPLLYHVGSSTPTKESTCNMGDLDSIPGLGRFLGEGNSYPLQYSAAEFYGQYSPWGRKELDTTEQLSLSKVQEGIRVSGHTYTKAQRPQVTWRVVISLVHMEWLTFYWHLVWPLSLIKCHVEYQRNERDTLSPHNFLGKHIPLCN